MARQSRRAKLFVLPLTTAISTAMLSCSSNPREWRTNADIKICVDDLDKRVPDGDCSNPGDQHHRWYYINEGGYVPYPGYPVRSGSYQPNSAGGSYGPSAGGSDVATPQSTRAGAITRGGFGESAEGHAAFGGVAGE